MAAHFRLSLPEAYIPIDRAARLSWIYNNSNPGSLAIGLKEK
jgi:hypothetical protein